MTACGKIRQPSDAIIAITHRCNAKCVMCNVWQSKAQDAITPACLDKLPASLRTVNITGGEPFLRDDLGLFVRQVRQRCPRAQITISTNGYLVERTVEMMDEIRKIDPTIRLAVSLDGLRETHDEIRGEAGFFDHATELLRRLAKAGFEGLRLSMTVSARNVSQLPEIANLAKSLGLELGIVAVHGAETHLGVSAGIAGEMPQNTSEIFGLVIEKLLRSWTPKLWLRAHFTARTHRYLLGKPKRFRCSAGRGFFFIQADGEVYNCSVLGTSMGNILTDDWQEIWTGQAGCDARARARACTQSCWMICTVRDLYRRDAIRVAGWILWHKLLAHLQPGKARLRI